MAYREVSDGLDPKRCLDDDAEQTVARANCAQQVFLTGAHLHKFAVWRNHFCAQDPAGKAGRSLPDAGAHARRSNGATKRSPREFVRADEFEAVLRERLDEAINADTGLCGNRVVMGVDIEDFVEPGDADNSTRRCRIAAGAGGARASRPNR